MEQLAIFTICTISGIFTGLLGIGGGLIIIPAFMIILPLFGITHFGPHQIIAISSTCVFLNSWSGLFYRRKEKFLEKKFVISASVAVIIGTLLSAYATSYAPIKPIFVIYILVCLVSIYLMKHEVHFKFNNNAFLYLLFGFIGAISAAIGIGGAVLFATVLKCFRKETTKELLPTITLIVALHALFAFLGKVCAGAVVFSVIPAALIASVIGAKIGVKISKKLSTKVIENLMVLILLVAIIRVGFEFFN
ncbi:sulfite exporter TauE/SafE family protein [bacterium]|nr:sulfite exporter TauE/SafE family protein [bacterium]